VSSVERWGRSGVKEKTDHPHYVPPIKGGIILNGGIRLTQVSTTYSSLCKL